MAEVQLSCVGCLYHPRSIPFRRESEPEKKLSLWYDGNNPFNPNAIAFYYDNPFDNEHVIGYVPERQLEDAALFLKSVKPKDMEFSIVDAEFNEDGLLKAFHVKVTG